jgi:hypothetical protein
MQCSFLSRLDQTSRIHGNITASNQSSFWHELGRPQIHGYDLLDAVFIDPLRFASVADEKVVRIFEAPRRFIEVLEVLGVAQFPEHDVSLPSYATIFSPIFSPAQSASKCQCSSSWIIEQSCWGRFYLLLSSRACL